MNKGLITSTKQDSMGNFKPYDTVINLETKIVAL